MSVQQWVQTLPSLNRDDTLQFFHNIHSGNRVYGRTDGTVSDHIHLRFQDGRNSGLNLDPVSGDVSQDGNVLGNLEALAIIALAAAVGGAVGAGEAALSDTAKNVFDPSAPSIPAGLIFPPA